MTITTAAELAKSMLDAMDRGDAAGYAAHYSTEAVSHDPALPEPAKGRGEIAAGAAAFIRAFPDLRCTVRSVIEEGNQIACEVTFAGTNDGPLETADGDLPPTGRPVSIEMFVRLERDSDGLVRSARAYYDVASFMAQLGMSG